MNPCVEIRRPCQYGPASCRYGSSCWFSHEGVNVRGKFELNNKSTSCRFFLKGACKFGDSCRYGHNGFGDGRQGAPAIKLEEKGENKASQLTRLMKLPVDFLIQLLKEFLDLEDACRLDTSMSNKPGRILLLEIYKSSKLHYDEKLLGNNVELNVNCLSWLVLRGLGVETLTLTRAFDSIFVYGGKGSGVVQRGEIIDQSVNLNQGFESTRLRGNAMVPINSNSNFNFNFNLSLNQILIDVSRNSPLLKSINLRINPGLDPFIIASIAHSCSNLEELRLYESHNSTFTSTMESLTHVDFILLQAAKYLAGLKRINLSNCHKTLSDYGLCALMRYCDKITYLNLEKCDKITAWGFDCLSRTCPLLDHVVLRECANLNDDNVMDIAHRCQFLRVLDISYCLQVTNRCIMYMASECKNLHTLVICCCHRLGDDALFALGDNCHTLTDLDISGCDSFTDDGISYFVSRNGAGIKALDIRSCLGCGDASLFAIADHCPHLRTLRITKWPTNAAVIKVAENCKEIEVWSLADCMGVTSDSFIAIAKNCPAILDLNLFNNYNLTDASLHEIANGCRGIHAIGLNRCFKVTDVGVLSLGTLCTHLNDITLSCNEYITDKSIVVLVENCKNLVSLCLNDVLHITNESIMAISLHSSKLKDLQLNRNINITDEGMEALAKGCPRKSLRYIWLNSCPLITNKTLDVLADGCPQLRLVSTERCKFVREFARKGLRRRIGHNP